MAVPEEFGVSVAARIAGAGTAKPFGRRV